MPRNLKPSDKQSETNNDVKPYSRLEFKGLGNVTLNNIGKSAKIAKSGMGNLIILGNISEDVSFKISGMGNVMINGTVGENVKFTISGLGNLKFKKRPPESVINNIKKSGWGKIKMPGGYSSTQSDNNNNDNYFTENVIIGTNIGSIGDSSITNIRNGNFGGTSIESDDGLVKVTKNGFTTTYAGNTISFINGQLILDGERVTDSDSRILHVENASASSNSTVVINNFSSTHSFLQSAFPINREANINHASEKKPDTETSLLNKYSDPTKRYIDTFNKKEKNTDALKDLDLSDDEKKLLENYYCPISLELINIPVILDGRSYDLDSLLQIQQKDQLDPCTRFKFYLRDIQNDRTKAEELQNIVLQIKAAHKNKNTSSNDAQEQPKQFKKI